MTKNYFGLVLIFYFLSSLFFLDECLAKRIKKNIYTVLEKEVPPSKFDNEGFYKRSFDELSKYLDQSGRTVYGGGYYCMSEKPITAGHIAGSSSQSDIFSKEDTVEIEVKDSMGGCSNGTKYIVVEREGTGVYKIIAELEALEKAVKQTRCVAKFTQVYSVVKRNAEVAYPISSGELKITQLKEIITGKVEAVWGDRVCIRFAAGYNTPEAGAMIYFYEIKDPNNNKEIDPYVVGYGQLIYSSGQYGTVVIKSLGRAVSKGTSITTRF